MPWHNIVPVGLALLFIITGIVLVAWITPYIVVFTLAWFGAVIGASVASMVFYFGLWVLIMAAILHFQEWREGQPT